MLNKLTLKQEIFYPNRIQNIRNFTHFLFKKTSYIFTSPYNEGKCKR